MHRPLELAFVGDVCLGMGWPARMREHGALYPFENVADLLDAVDLTVANLECCLVDATCPEDAHHDRMAVPAEFATGICDAGIDALDLVPRIFNYYTKSGSPCVSSVRWAKRAIDSRIWSADLVHLNGFGSSLWASR